MNLFILSLNPEEIAKYMMDKHIAKIILEAVQMLCSAKRLIDGGVGGDARLSSEKKKKKLRSPGGYAKHIRRDEDFEASDSSEDIDNRSEQDDNVSILSLDLDDDDDHHHKEKGKYIEHHNP